METISNRTRIKFSRHTTVGRQNPYDRPDDIAVERLQRDVAPFPLPHANMLVLKKVPSQIEITTPIKLNPIVHKEICSSKQAPTPVKSNFCDHNLYKKVFVILTKKVISCHTNFFET